jgi:hypothetical protein
MYVYMYQVGMYVCRTCTLLYRFTSLTILKKVGSSTDKHARIYVARFL